MTRRVWRAVAVVAGILVTLSAAAPLLTPTEPGEPNGVARLRDAAVATIGTIGSLTARMRPTGPALGAGTAGLALAVVGVVLVALAWRRRRGLPRRLHRDVVRQLRRGHSVGAVAGHARLSRDGVRLIAAALNGKLLPDRDGAGNDPQLTTTS